ncbi:MAG: stalk domain-containing protein, partial [Syntrophomonadaceae bacterium]
SAATAVVSVSVANIRSSPTVNSTNIVGTVYQNTPVQISSQNGQWYQVTMGKVSGWMNQSVLNIVSAPAVQTVNQTATASLAAVAPVIILDGQELHFDVPPLVQDGRILVPLAAIFQAMGATLSWDAASATVTATREGTTVVVAIGSASPTVNGKIWTLDAATASFKDRTFAPLRFVGEALGGIVSWDAATNTANLTSPIKNVGTVIANASTVNLRSGPGTTYAIVAVAHDGDRLPVSAVQNSWYQVTYGESKAWVAGWLVEADPQSVTTDVKNPTNAGSTSSSSSPGSAASNSPVTSQAPVQTTDPSQSGDDLDTWIAKAIAQTGVSADWAPALKWIIDYESSGNPDALNPKCNAYGLMQMKVTTWAQFGMVKSADPVEQVVVGIMYIEQRYGTAQAALAFLQANGWY